MTPNECHQKSPKKKLKKQKRERNVEPYNLSIKNNCGFVKLPNKDDRI